MTPAHLDIKTFIRDVAAASPAPGGGSVAALCGSLGAALCHMVAGLTLGKKKYKTVEPLMSEIKEKADTLQKKLLELVQEDTLAYNRVLDAYQLPRKTLAEIETRTLSIQDALKHAAAIPCQTLETAASAMDLVALLIEKGNPNCLTDAGVAAELIAAAVRGSAYNVYVNLIDIKDSGFSIALKQKAYTVRQDTHVKISRLRETIEHAINMEP